MKFWKFSSQTLATLLSVVSLTQAGGPSDGEATADPNSAVVKLTAATYKTFLDSNPLVLTEFFAPWCGYCKQLGPEFSKAADSLNETHPKIKLAQIDCEEEVELCQQNGIRGYPTLKIARGAEASEDYEGPREAAGIADYMIKQSLPAVQIAEDFASFETLVSSQTKPFVISVNPSGSDDEVYEGVANQFRKDHAFVSVDGSFVKDLKSKYTGAKIDAKKPTYIVVHPSSPEDSTVYTGDVNVDDLSAFVKSEVVPYFGDINGETYLTYMSSTLPLGYYFYSSPEQREEFAPFFTKLAKQYRGKINFVGLDASLFGKHAEAISMDPEIVPLFAIQQVDTNRKYGVDQKANPDGPSEGTIEAFVQDFFDGKLSPIIKSEPLPTEEEIAANPVVKLVGHNYDEVVKDVTKDVFVKYYAPWCGHCKKLAPTWDELAELFDAKNPESQVVIANIDHSNNDVDVPIEIEGYPTLLLYPANGEIDEKTGIRKPIVFNDKRELDELIDFIKENGAHKVDGHELKGAKVEILEEDETPVEDVLEQAADAVTGESEATDVDHDEL